MDQDTENVVKEYEPGEVIEIRFWVELPKEAKKIVATFLDPRASTVKDGKHFFLMHEYDEVPYEDQLWVTLSRLVDKSFQEGVYKLAGVYVHTWADTVMHSEGAPVGNLIRIKADSGKKATVSHWEWS